MSLADEERQRVATVYQQFDIAYCAALNGWTPAEQRVCWVFHEKARSSADRAPRGKYDAAFKEALATFGAKISEAEYAKMVRDSDVKLSAADAAQMTAAMAEYDAMVGRVPINVASTQPRTYLLSEPKNRLLYGSLSAAMTRIVIDARGTVLKDPNPGELRAYLTLLQERGEDAKAAYGEVMRVRQMAFPKSPSPPSYDQVMPPQAPASWAAADRSIDHGDDT